MITGGQGHEMLKSIESNRALQIKPGQVYNTNKKILFAKISNPVYFPALKPQKWTPQRRVEMEAKIREYRLQERQSWIRAIGIALFLFGVLAYFLQYLNLNI